MIRQGEDCGMQARERVGQRVAKGEVIGTAAAGLHVGVRLGDAYLDPAVVFGGRRLVRLVPDGVPASPVRVRLHARTAAAGASAVRIAGSNRRIMNS